MKRFVRMLCAIGVIGCLISGCSRNQEPSTKEIVEDFDKIIPAGEEPVILRDETAQNNETTQSQGVDEIEQSQSVAATEEVEPYVDRFAKGTKVLYHIESTFYEEGAVKITYPQFTEMSNIELQQQINETIKTALLSTVERERLVSYELGYETASMGGGISSFVLKGSSYYEGSAYPVNVVKTLNIDMTTGQNVRFKDYADISTIVSNLEMATGYQILNDGVNLTDFSAFLNNGYMTDYAITLLDFDIDFKNIQMRPAGYSAIRNNHLILFIEAEHAMGDYVELEFDADL